ncbi:MAG TPA: CAP domain-containing protein [Sphingobacterium sp.]|nr:CAP domain-containing protein [Sphingobacterium sp.]
MNEQTIRRYIFALLFLIFGVTASQAQSSSSDLTSSEMELYRLIMEYRQQKGLPRIPISKSLTHVAKLHVKDLQENFVRGTKCNMHSWSDKGNWTACCYTSDHAQAHCMWNKPRELTTYKGNGFEISYWHSAAAEPIGALNSWKKSSGHNSLLINAGVWTKQAWKAIGIGIYKEYAVIWFGVEEDLATHK